MTYRYRKNGKFLICIDQSFTTAIRQLVIGYRENGLRSLGFSGKVIIRVIKIFTKSKLRPVNPDQCLSLPVFGHVGLQVHRGVKLFNLERHEVTKYFGNDVTTEEAAAEIQASKLASSIKSAPRFLMADAGSAWFKEEFVRGSHATDLVEQESSDFLRYYAEVENCLLELAGSQPPLSVDTAEYIDDVANVEFEDRWLAAGIGSDDISRISEYVSHVRAWLHRHTDFENLQLVLTHGDFSLVNMLVSNGGMRIIDWDGIGFRSALGDIFNFALAESYYGRASAEFTDEALALFERYRAAIATRYPELQKAASIDISIALRLYYLERIQWLIERDASPNLAGVVNKSIAMFNQFDEDLDLPELQ